MNAIRSYSLPDQIYHALRSAILTGELAPGQRLVELDIAAQMGTSQGPVREALQRLENDGLIEKRPRSGTFVSSPSLTDILELFQVRALVEKFAAGRLAATITQHQLATLQSLVQNMHHSAAADDLTQLSAYDLEFHRLIMEWSGSQPLLRVWLPLYSQIQRFVIQSHRSLFHNLQEIAALHQDILTALQQRDPQLASQVIETHILLTLHRHHPSQLAQPGESTASAFPSP